MLPEHYAHQPLVVYKCSRIQRATYRSMNTRSQATYLGKKIETRSTSTIYQAQIKNTTWFRVPPELLSSFCNHSSQIGEVSTVVSTLSGNRGSPDTVILGGDEFLPVSTMFTTLCSGVKSWPRIEAPCMRIHGDPSTGFFYGYGVRVRTDMNNKG